MKALTPMQRWTLWHVAHDYVPRGYLLPLGYKTFSKFCIQGKDVTRHMQTLRYYRYVRLNDMLPIVTERGVTALWTAA